MRVRSDNSTVVAYINHQGGTRSTSLCFQTWSLLLWCQSIGTSLTSLHVPGIHNTLADSLSRGTFGATEWELHQGILDSVWLVVATGLGNPI